MKRLLMAVAVVMIFGVGNAIAQQYEVDAHPADGVYDTEVDTVPGGQVCFDVLLTGSPIDNPGAGGVWIDFNGAGSLASYVSATDFVPPWTAGPTVNEPAGPSTFLVKLPIWAELM